MRGTIWWHAVSILPLALGCGRIGFDPICGGAPDATVDAISDAPSDAPLDVACLADGWTVAAVDSVGSDGTDWGAQISEDGLTLFFASDRNDGGQLDLFVARRTSRDVDFDPPELLSVSTPASESNPSPSHDLSELFFDRGGSVIRAVLVDDGSYVEDGTVAAVELDDGTIVTGPHLAADGRTLHYGRFSCADPCSTELSHQIEMTTRPGPASPLAFAPGTLVPLVGAVTTGFPALSADMRVLLVEGRDALGEDANIYVAIRDDPSGAFGPLVRMAISTPTEDSDPSITADGRELYYSVEAGSSDHDIFVATRDTPCW